MIDKSLKFIREAIHVKAFGGGMASNVVKFHLRESVPEVANNVLDSKPVIGTRGHAQQDFAYYARMNMGSAASFMQVLNFYKYISVNACKQKPGFPAQPLYVPEPLLNININEAGFQELFLWMSEQHEQPRNGKLAITDWAMRSELPSRKEFNRAEFSSISVVQGVTAVGLLEHMVLHGKTMQGSLDAHIRSLGILHAIDVAVGMGDRLQNPNPANVTINPRNQQLILIDFDYFLPPKNCPEEIEKICTWGEDKFNLNPHRKLDRRNEAFVRHREAWTACPPRLPLQGNYMQGVDSALKVDLQIFTEGLQDRIGVISTNNIYHEKRPDPMGLSHLKNYVKALEIGENLFMDAARTTLKFIKDEVLKHKRLFDVEDPTCSAKRLKERVRQWSF